MKSNDARLTTIPVFLNGIGWSLLFIDQVRIEDIEFVSLHDFGGWIIMIVMCLVVFVPLITRMHAVEVLWLPRAVLIMPPVHLKQEGDKRNLMSD